MRIQQGTLNRSGLTLVEIILVVVIIGILAAMVIPNIAGRSEEARRGAVRADIEANLSVALDMYELDGGSYPTTDQGLKALFQKPTSAPVPSKWSGPYLKKKKMPRDPWGRDYGYRGPGTHNPESYDLFSLGPDGIESSDDINNWDNDTAAQ